jgi:hypothetical protein
MKSEIRAALTVTGKQLDQEVIAEVVGITPARSWRQGDMIEGTTIVRKIDGCVICEMASDGLDLPALVAAVLAPILQRRTTFVSMCRSNGWEAEIACAAYVTDQTPMLSFGAELIQQAASLEAGIDIDVILLGEGGGGVSGSPIRGSVKQEK